VLFRAARFRDLCGKTSSAFLGPSNGTQIFSEPSLTLARLPIPCNVGLSQSDLAKDGLQQPYVPRSSYHQHQQTPACPEQCSSDRSTGAEAIRHQIQIKIEIII